MRDCIVFFVRAHNDLDHMCPIMYKLALTGEVDVRLVLTTSSVSTDDFRIRFLCQTATFDLLELRERYPNLLQSLFRALKRQISLRELLVFRVGTLLNCLGLYGFMPNGPDPAAATIAEGFFAELQSRSSRILLCFDHNMDAFSRAMTTVAHEKGMASAALPHGDCNYVSVMGGAEVTYHRHEEFRQQMLDLYDAYFLPNALMYEKGGYGTLPRNSRVKLTGSPRYNSEWLDILGGIAPPRQAESEALTVVVLMKFLGWPIHLEEVVRALEIISNFSQVNVKVKFHTRLSGMERTQRHFRRLRKLMNDRANVSFHFDETPTCFLIRAADLVIDLGTSAAFEAVALKINVAALEYVHPDLTTTAALLPGTVLRCRDDVHELIRRSLEDPESARTYDDAEREEFLKTIGAQADRPVLENYVDELTRLLYGGPIGF